MSYTLPSADSHYITLSQAQEMTARFRSNSTTVLKDDYATAGILPNSETFSIDAFQSFFSNPDCKGIRIYSGMDSDLKLHLIAVGVDVNGEDILPTEENSEIRILEEGKRCPPYCPVTLL